MEHVFKDNSLSIGRTPLVQLNRITAGCKAKVFAFVIPAKAGIQRSLNWTSAYTGVTVRKVS